MSPEDRRYSDQIERYLPPEPSLFSGVRRVLVATLNFRKLYAVNGWLNDLGILRGDSLLTAQSILTSKEEPDWHNPILVAQHKRDCVVEQIRGQFGPKTLVIGSDVVVRVNGEAFLNLSRQADRDPGEEVKRLVTIFSQPSRIVWDVVVAASTVDVKVSMADRHMVWYRPIPEDEIREAFWGDVSKALGIGPRVNLIEDFTTYIDDFRSVPASRLLLGEGPFPDVDEWSDRIEKVTLGKNYELSQYNLDQIGQSVVGGFPVGDRARQLAFEVPINGYKGERYI